MPLSRPDYPGASQDPDNEETKSKEHDQLVQIAEKWNRNNDAWNEIAARYPDAEVFYENCPSQQVDELRRVLAVTQEQYQAALSLTSPEAESFKQKLKENIDHMDGSIKEWGKREQKRDETRIGQLKEMYKVNGQLFSALKKIIDKYNGPGGGNIIEVASPEEMGVFVDYIEKMKQADAALKAMPFPSPGKPTPELFTKLRTEVDAELIKIARIEQAQMVERWRTDIPGKPREFVLPTREPAKETKAEEQKLDDQAINEAAAETVDEVLNELDKEGKQLGRVRQKLKNGLSKALKYTKGLGTTLKDHPVEFLLGTGRGDQASKIASRTTVSFVVRQGLVYFTTIGIPVIGPAVGGGLGAAFEGGAAIYQERQRLRSADTYREVLTGLDKLPPEEQAKRYLAVRSSLERKGRFDAADAEYIRLMEEVKALEFLQDPEWRAHTGIDRLTNVLDKLNGIDEKELRDDPSNTEILNELNALEKEHGLKVSGKKVAIRAGVGFATGLTAGILGPIIAKTGHMFAGIGAMVGGMRRARMSIAEQRKQNKQAESYQALLAPEKLAEMSPTDQAEQFILIQNLIDTRRIKGSAEQVSDLQKTLLQQQTDIQTFIQSDQWSAEHDELTPEGLELLAKIVNARDQAERQELIGYFSDDVMGQFEKEYGPKVGKLKLAKAIVRGVAEGIAVGASVDYLLHSLHIYPGESAQKHDAVQSKGAAVPDHNNPSPPPTPPAENSHLQQGGGSNIHDKAQITQGKGLGAPATEAHNAPDADPKLDHETIKANKDVWHRIKHMYQDMGIKRPSSGMINQAMHETTNENRIAIIGEHNDPNVDYIMQDRHMTAQMIADTKIDPNRLREIAEQHGAKIDVPVDHAADHAAASHTVTPDHAAADHGADPNTATPDASPSPKASPSPEFQVSGAAEGVSQDSGSNLRFYLQIAGATALGAGLLGGTARYMYRREKRERAEEEKKKSAAESPPFMDDIDEEPSIGDETDNEDPADTAADKADAETPAKTEPIERPATSKKKSILETAQQRNLDTKNKATMDAWALLHKKDAGALKAAKGSLNSEGWNAVCQAITKQDYGSTDFSKIEKALDTIFTRIMTIEAGAKSGGDSSKIGPLQEVLYNLYRLNPEKIGALEQSVYKQDKFKKLEWKLPKRK